jgi:ketosteroid isomerase-like protein
MLSRILAVGWLALFSIAPPLRAQQSSKDALKAFETAFNERDVADLVALHTRDGVRMPPDVPSVKGEEALKKYFEDSFEFYESAELSLKEGGKEEGPDMIVSWGTYSITVVPNESDEEITSSGKWLTLSAKMTDGTLKMKRAIWNPDAPAP